MCSIRFACPQGWIISHEKFVDDMYQHVQSNDGPQTLKIRPTLFDINSKFLRKNQTKYKAPKRRKMSTPEEKISETAMIKKSYEEVMERAGPDMFTPRTAKDNKAAMDLREQLSLKESQIQHSHGCNESKNAVIVKIEAEDYVFPRNSHFYCHDVRDLASKKVRMDKKFDLVLMDPPWWNKSVRRRKKSSSDGYDMMYNQEVVDIPVRDLLKPDGVVAVWCTTSSSCLDSILNEMFPAWGVVFRAKWYWIKVTKSGQTVHDFNENDGKQPYELLVIGCRSSERIIEDGKVFLSVPSAIHSHKPPLIDILASFLPRGAECLEIFSRYLLPDWTSWGLQVLKLQSLDLYEKCPIPETQ